MRDSELEYYRKTSNKLLVIYVSVIVAVLVYILDRVDLTSWISQLW